MRRLAFIGLASFGACLVSGCGDNSDLECGPGTADVDGQCVAGADDTTPPTTAISPDPGTYRTVGGLTLTADEPAIIFFTTDGSEPDVASSFGGFSPVTLPALEGGTEIKFFAIDDAGNVEATQTAVYELDQVPPAPACGFAASAEGLNASVSWTNPTDDDFAGLIVVRYDAVAAVGRPVAGDFYSAGDTLPGGGEVILAGTDTSLTDTLPAATGAYVYAVWTHDSLGNYSIASSNRPLATALARQTATVTVNLATEAVTIDAQPADLALTVAATYDGGAQQLTLEVSARNNTARQLFNLRLESTEVTTTPAGLSGGVPPAAGTFGDPLAANGLGTAVLPLEGVPNTAATATVAIEFETAPYIFGNNQAISASGLDPSVGLEVQFEKNSRGVLINPMGTQALLDQKAGPTRVFDLLTFSDIGPLLNDVGSVYAAAYTNAGVPFVVTQELTHWYGTRGGGNAALYPNEVVLHQLDPITLEPIRSLVVMQERGLVARQLLLFPDCRTAALVAGSGDPLVGNKVAIVDINEMTVDRVINLPEPTGGAALVERAALSPNGDAIYVGLNSRARVLVNANPTKPDRLGGGGSSNPFTVPLLRLDLTTDQATEIEIPNGGEIAAGILPVDDLVYYSSRSQNGTPTAVVAIDTADSDSITTVVGSDVFSRGGGNIVLSPVNDVFAVWGGGRTSEAAVVDLETGTIIEGASLPTVNMHPHGIAVTPF